MFATGLTAAGVQIVFLREYLSIFSGNELVIGVILALWLLATAAGSYAGNRFEFNNPRDTRFPRFPRLLSFLYVFSIISGLLLLRASRLLFQSGEVIPPWYILFIVLLTQSDAAFFGGFTFGRLARRGNGQRVYLMENAGAAAGLLFVSLCIIYHFSNGLVLAGTLFWFSMIICYYEFSVFFKFYLIRFFNKETVAASCEADIEGARQGGGPRGAKQECNGQSRQKQCSFLLFPGLLFLIAGLIVIDPVSVRWKYGPNIDKVVNGHEGEIALKRGGAVFLNNTLYRAGMALPSIEQAVHLPAAMHAGPLRRALVIGNAGHVLQLRKYGNLSVECLETEPFLATGGCTCGAVETMSGNRSFDLVLLGSGMPATGAAGRFYTNTFFKKMRGLTGDSGVFSFTLPLSENFLSPQEQRIKDLLQVTLAAAFRHVLVVPGEGYTFIASDMPLPWPVKPIVRTDYLESYTLASLTPERLKQANMLHDSLRINTIGEPYSLLIVQKQWLGLFGVPLFFFLGVLALMLALAIAVSSRTKPAFSVATSGFAAGVYSVALMLLYQFSHGTLYSGIAVLMIALTIGFVAGSRLKRFVFSDGAIGLYVAVTLIALVTVPFPPLALFCVFHAGIGFLSGAQFVTRRGTSWGGLYAADLAGGVFGMALCSTLLIPSFGVTTVALGLCLMKLAAEVITAG
jgi:spermidine synthase